MNHRVLRTKLMVFSKENCSFELATGMAKDLLFFIILLSFTHWYFYKRTCKMLKYNILSQFILSFKIFKFFSLTQQWTRMIYFPSQHPAKTATSETFIPSSMCTLKNKIRRIRGIALDFSSSKDSKIKLIVCN